ncbi:MAG: hypothetical protein ACTHLW_02515 [Verrucomicrobiota bacterium]
MKILLQQQQTGLYLQLPELWIQEIKAASDFGTSQRALAYAKTNCLMDVQVVAAFLRESCVESVAYQVEPPRRLRSRLQS